METGLTPDNSDLIALIESQLLGTELHVNGDENMLMADSLLDLEPDTMSLGQSTRTSTVIRVPYKEMNDSQTSNSRLSSELCCKGQIRPNNNSALVDTTRSTHSDELLPMEVVTEDESQTAALPAILLKKSNWVTDETETLIKENRGDDNCTTSRLCQQQFTTHHRLQVHVSHYTITVSIIEYKIPQLVLIV